jgi:hypothetical protein
MVDPEVVVGADRKGLKVTFRDRKKVLVVITGGTVRLQGKSDDLPGKVIDVEGTVVDGPNGVGRWPELGGATYVTAAELGAKPGATFSLRAKFTDSGGKQDWSEAFPVRWVSPPT